MATNNNTVQQAGGVSFMSLLFFVFLTLKLTGNITWSWLWVTAPLWGPLFIVATLVVFTIVMAIIGGACKGIANGRRKLKEQA